MIRRSLGLTASALALLSCSEVAAPAAAGSSGGGASGASAGGELGGSGMNGGSSSGGVSGSGGSAGAAVEMPTTGLTARPPNGACKVSWTDPKAPPASLKATGCVDATDPLAPGAALIPFTVLSPLWSDGAEKERYMLIPDDEQITVKDCELSPEQCPAVCTPGLPCEMEGEFQFPIGTILIKNFSLGTERVETRLLVRFSEEEWFGHSYKWRADHSDADLVDRLGEDVSYQVNGAEQIWHYPSGADCMQCHTTAAGFSLGPEVMQLNADFKYPNGITGNQLETLAGVDLFSAPIPDRLKSVKLAAYEDAAAPLETRARAYLHANCGQCHRPGSNKPTVDFRFTTALAQTGACNTDSAVQDGTLGIAGAKILAPGAHAQSLVWARMSSLESSVRMPQLATSIKDDAGTQLIADWIDALTLADCAK